MITNNENKLLEVLKPVNSAKGLPNENYTTDAIFEIEKKSIFFGSWSGVGFGKDVPKIGDAYPIDYCGIPLLIVREESDKIRVFENTCRHRGMVLVRKKTTLRGTIRCPYHSWCYLSLIHI